MQHSTKSFTIEELLLLVDRGAIALPEFQRDFIWDPSRVVELLDSVLNGWPIGALLLLEGPQPFRIRQLEQAPLVDESSVDYYLLDGQQRLTALYLALRGVGDVHYFVDLDQLDEDERPSLRWTRNPKGVQLGTSARRIPVAAILSTEAWESFLPLLTADSQAWLDSARSELLGESGSAPYEVPTIVMERSISLEALTRIFETLNRTGVRLSAFDLMVAVLYPAGMHLGDEWDSALKGNPTLTHYKAEGIEVLKLIALWQRDADESSKARPSARRVKGIRQRDVLATPASTVLREWGRAVEGYRNALDWQHTHAGVRDASGLPSDTMTLAIAYRLDRGDAVADTSVWFWASIAKQTYSQGANTQILTDLNKFNDPIDPADTLEAMRSSLFDEVRRNRILRLGLRGLAVLNGAQDPVSKEPLGDGVIDVSLPDLAGGKLSVSGGVALRHLVWINRSSFSSLRKLIAGSPGPAIFRELYVPALATQGFGDGEPTLADSSTAVDPRVKYLLAWMGARL